MQLFLVGAGYVGLVTAVGMSRLGHHVTVADIDEARIERLRAGRAPLFEPGLEEAIAERRELLEFTTDLRPPAGVRHSFVAVGTPEGLDGPLSMEYVLQAVGSLLEQVDGDHVIVVRSTLPLSGPGVLTALRAGRTQDPADTPAIVTNPEFMREGSALRDFQSPGRVIAGWLEERDRPAAEEVLELYQGIDAPTIVGDARSVALIKLASNVFLAMKVAYANELARLSDAIGADAPLVSDGLGLDARIGRQFLDAGPGYGGSCLPEQAIALARMTAAAGITTPLIESVALSNQTHQSAIAGRLGALLGGLEGKRIALLGLAFKANTDDVRYSPALVLAQELRDAGAIVVGTDPRAVDRALQAMPDLEVAASPQAAAEGADGLLIATEWPEYRDIDWPMIGAVMRGSVVYDTRNVANPVDVAAAGLTLERLGRPDSPVPAPA